MQANGAIGEIRDKVVELVEEETVSGGGGNSFEVSPLENCLSCMGRVAWRFCFGML
jgi:hypothetical protein